MSDPKVVNVRGRKYLEFGGKSGVIYVGRAVPRAGYQRSRWANPWKVQDFATPEDCIDHYKAMIQIVLGYAGPGKYDTRLTSTYDWEMFREGIHCVHLLAGRTLGCWCCDWDGTSEPSAPCHAVVLWKLANLGVQAI
jgi:hypothetical protein